VRSRQLDLFLAEPQTPLVGLRVKLDRPADRDRACCRNICTIGPGKGPHAGELICADCNQHRSWISNATAYWIERVIARFGAPTSPIVVRKSSLERPLMNVTALLGADTAPISRTLKQERKP
jgi:hypothetical protein